MNKDSYNPVEDIILNKDVNPEEKAKRKARAIIRMVVARGNLGMCTNLQACFEDDGYLEAISNLESQPAD